MHALTNLDASWLLGETAATPFHVANLLIFDKPAGKKQAPFDAFRAHLKSKLDELPLFHRRVDPTSVQLANPVWIDDPEVDWDYHLKRTSVKAPGGVAQLNALVAELHEPMLDRAHPLWQAWFIEGLATGGFAVYLKMHHAAVDGAAVNFVLDALFSEPGRASPQVPPVAKQRKPTPLELVWNANLTMLTKGPMALLKHMPDMMKEGMAALQPKEGGQTNLAMLKAPRTPFNASVKPGRTFGSAFLSLPEVKALGKKHGATVNDIVLIICAGALRKYLEKRNCLPKEPLVVGMPVAMRPEGNREPTNQVFIMTTSLPTDVADVPSRVPVVRANIRNSKLMLDASRPMARMMIDMPSMRLPNFPNLASMMEAFKLIEDMGATGTVAPFVNLWFSNIPGPRTPLYCGDVVAKTNIPVGFPMQGVGLNITAISYLDSMDFGVVGSSSIIPDAQELADLLAAEFDVVRDALG